MEWLLQFRRLTNRYSDGVRFSRKENKIKIPDWEVFLGTFESKQVLEVKMIELESWQGNNVYEEVQRLKPNQKILTSRWVVTEIERRKEYM